MGTNTEDDDAKTEPRLDEHDVVAGPLPGLDSLLDRNDRGKLHQLGPGMVIDNTWELRRLLGEGAFGQVYEAWHVELDHPVAIKILTGGHGRAEVRQRFLEEARLMAGMVSKHLVRASDYGELPDGSPYFVMDLVKGRSLRHVLRERLSLWRALELAEELLEGLVEVHRRGVVHGDIKPENIVVGEDDDEARLLDFGLSQTSAADGEDVGGTPHYMAPEMLLERVPASARTDVYAVGVVLYEMLTGRLPRGHLDMSVEQLRKAWVSKPKPNPVLMYCKGVPQAQQEALEALDKLVMEALAGEPTSRPKSAQPLLDELRRLRLRLSPEALAPTLAPESTAAKSSVAEVKTTKPYGTIEGRSWAVLRTIAVVAVLVLAVVLAGWWWSQEREREMAQTEQTAIGQTEASRREEPKPAPTKRAPTFDPKELARARGGVLVAAPEGASAASMGGYTAMCKALGGERPLVEGTMPVICREVPRSAVDDLMLLAQNAGVRVVVLVGHGSSEELEVRTTSHHRGNKLLAQLNGLPLPENPTAVAQVAPVLKAVVGLSTTEARLEALPWKEVGARWGVLSEWVRLQQGHLAHEDLLRRKALADALDRMLTEARAQDDEQVIGFYRDLAMLVVGSSACTGSEPTLGELSKAGHAEVIKIAALLGRAACRVGEDAGPRPDEAKALLEEAFTLSQDHPCVRVSAIGTISWIDRWNGNDAQWAANATRLPEKAACDPASWSPVLTVRGDALVARKRWCDAAGAYAQAYGVLRTKVEPLLNWAEYDWRCRPSRETPRQALLDELRAALASDAFRQSQTRVSLAYLLWWLTRDATATELLLKAYDAIAEGEVALMAGIASDLDREICRVARPKVCSRSILTRAKRPGDAELLRRSLEFRDLKPQP